MIVMDNNGDIFDERRKRTRRKISSRRKGEKEIMIDRREDIKDRRSGEERRKKDINKKTNE